MKKVLLFLVVLSTLSAELASAKRLTGRRPQAAASVKSSLVRGPQVDVYRSDFQSGVLNKEESEHQTAIKSASQSGVIGQVYSNIRIGGRTFAFQIEDIEINSNKKPVVKGWMCRKGNSQNKNSSITVLNSRVSYDISYVHSENLENTTVPENLCDTTQTNGRFAIEVTTYYRFMGNEDQIIFTLKHNFDEYTINLGPVRNWLTADEDEAARDWHSQTPPEIITNGTQFSSTDIVQMRIWSYERLSSVTNNNLQTQMCAERSESNNCNGTWITPNYSYTSLEQLINIYIQNILATPTNDINYYTLHFGYSGDVADYVIADIQKQFRPVDFGMTPGSYTIYYKNSYGHTASTTIEVLP